METIELEVAEAEELEVAPANVCGYQSLLIRQIRRDGGTQARIGLHEDTVQEYADLMRDKVWDFQSRQRPIVLYDGEAFWLADGFHRIEAAQRAQLSDFPVEVLRGTKRDAVLRAAGANSQHGLRRTNADKRRAVELLLRDDEWRQWSDRKIADTCAVDHKTVADVRKSLSGEIPQIETRTVERNGKTYQMTPTAKPLTASKSSAITASNQALAAVEADGRAALGSADTQHSETIKAILKEAEGKGERTGTRLYQQAYDHAREIHDVALYNKMIALIDRATDEPPAAPAPDRDSPDNARAWQHQEAIDADLISTAQANIGVGNVADARALLDQVSDRSAYARDQLLATIAPAAPTARESAAAFLAEQRDRLTRFSQSAMVSQTTFKTALDHIHALLDGGA